MFNILTLKLKSRIGQENLTKPVIATTHTKPARITYLKVHNNGIKPVTSDSSAKMLREMCMYQDK